MWVLAYFTQDGQPVTGLSPTTLIKDVDTGLDVITSAAMSDIGDGFYRYDFSTHDPNKNYAVTCDSITLSGVERYTYASSGEYGEVLDTIESTVTVVDVRTTLLRKIQTNRLELFDGATDNWVLYDDDAVTPLLTFSVSDKNGDIIVQCPGSPSKRSGVAGISGTQPPHEGELHYRLHSMTNPLDHYANANKLFYSDNSGDVQELAHGPVSTILASTGSGSAPAWTSLAGAGNVLVTYDGGGNDITISGTTGSWQFGVGGTPWDVIGNGELLDFNGHAGVSIRRSAENEITFSGTSWQYGINNVPKDVIEHGDILYFNGVGSTIIYRTGENEITISGTGGPSEWQFGVNSTPEDIISSGEILYFNQAGTTTITRSNENEITISGGTGEWQYGVNNVPKDIISSGDILYFNSFAGIQIERTGPNEITFSGSSAITDYYTQGEVTTISGDIVAQIITEHNNLLSIQGGLPNNYYHITDAQRTYLTNVSGALNASSQHIHDDRYYTQLQITTISGDIVAQIPTDYYTQSEVTTISGDIVAQIITDHNNLSGLQGGEGLSNAFYHLSYTEYLALTSNGGVVDASGQHRHDSLYVTHSGMTTISGDIVSQIITDHNNLSGIQGGSSSQRYHLTGGQHSTLTNISGVVDASDQHIHDDRYYTETEVDQLIGINKSGREPVGLKDTGTSVSFATAFPNSNYSLFVSLENTIDSPASEYAINIDGKTASGFSVHYSGKIDSNNYYLNWYATTSGVSGGNYISELQDDTSPALGGDLDINSYGIELNTTPSGQVISGYTVGYSGDISTMVIDWNDTGVGCPLHMKSNGHWEQCVAASGTARIPCAALALEQGTGTKKILWNGLIRRGSWAWAPGDIIYVSTVEGALTSVAPTNTGSWVQPIGVAISSDTIRFDSGFNPGEINS